MSTRRSLSKLLIRQYSSLRIPDSCVIYLNKMEPKINLKQDPAYKKLQEYYNANAEKINILQLFQQDADRFKKFRYLVILYSLNLNISALVRSLL